MYGSCGVWRHLRRPCPRSSGGFTFFRAGAHRHKWRRRGAHARDRPRLSLSFSPTAPPPLPSGGAMVYTYTYQYPTRGHRTHWKPNGLARRAGAGGVNSHDLRRRRRWLEEIPRDYATQCRSIRGPRNTYGPLWFASVMCVNRPHRHQHYSARDDTLGTCGRDASWY